MDSSSAKKQHPVVLVVEDEPVLRASTVRGLSKLSGIEVVGAGTVADATQLIEVTRPQLLVSDLDLPDGTGVELINVLDRQEIRVPIIFVSGYVSTFRPLIPLRSNIEVREKPVPLDTLRELVQQRLGRRVQETADSSADEAPFSASDYIQLSCLGRHSVALSFRRDNAVVGEAEVIAGEIWSAQDQRGTGADALRRLIFDNSLRIACRTSNRTPAARNLQGSWQEILLDAARLYDEESRDAGKGGAVEDEPAEAPDAPEVSSFIPSVLPSAGLDMVPSKESWADTLNETPGDAGGAAAVGGNLESPVGTDGVSSTTSAAPRRGRKGLAVGLAVLVVVVLAAVALYHSPWKKRFGITGAGEEGILQVSTHADVDLFIDAPSAKGGKGEESVRWLGIAKPSAPLEVELPAGDYHVIAIFQKSVATTHHKAAVQRGKTTVLRLE